MQIVFVPHGGGPLPLLGEPGHRVMVDFMTELPVQLTKPEAIIVVSAHWEERSATVLGAERPPMLYDYYGFPKEAYEIVYPAPGHPTLAKRLAGLLAANDIPARVDVERGFDHGTYIPLKLIYPEAEIPTIQLSLVGGLEPGVHIAIGKTLRALVDENILVLGSGFSFHNQRAFFGGNSDGADPQNDAFQDWLIETCTGSLSQREREDRLMDWEQAPGARYCHPREEHLLPLHVCFGATQGSAEVVFDGEILGKRGVGFLWKS